MKQLLKKFSSSELFVLPEAAAYLKVSEKYLTRLIRDGKVKAYQVDGQWFLEERWLQDFKQTLKHHLTQTVAEHYEINRKRESWTREITATGEFNWLSPLVWFWQSILLAVAVICISYLMLPLIEFNSQKQQGASVFLAAVETVYAWPLKVAETSLAQGPYNDEILTSQAGRLIAKLRFTGRVAGAFAEKEPLISSEPGVETPQTSY